MQHAICHHSFLQHTKHMLVVVAAGPARLPTATALQARGGEVARQPPRQPMECPHIVSITLARRSELSLGWLDALPNAHKLCTALCLRQDLTLTLTLALALALTLTL